MKRINNKKNLIKSIILLVILVIGIGYAYLTSNLSISGQTEVVANTWNIHFENLNIKNGSVTATTPATIQSNNVDITYAITLSRPKDFYEFTVDVKNDGTLPGKVSISSLSGITNEASPIIDYSVKYKNGNSVNIGDILNAGAKKIIKVIVYYKDDISATDFPSNNLNLTLTYTLQYLQSEEEEFDTNALIKKLKTDNSTCFTKYEGQVTDQVGETVTASNVYFNKCADKRNIIFNNMCWQMIRTTENSGIKMLYNGEVVDGKCESTRGNHVGITSGSTGWKELNAIHLYGSSFSYDTTNNLFTLLDTETAIWSDSTYEDLIGKYTCLNPAGICSTIINVNEYFSNTTASVSYYNISNTSYLEIGTSVFNKNNVSPAYVGYMFNKVYLFKSRYNFPTNETYKFGSTFTYNNGTYTLSGTTQDISDWSTGYNQLNNTHYTCWNSSGICNSISYVYYTYNSGYSEGAYYIDITDGKSINDVLVEMLSSNDVNRYNSNIKGIIDAWYRQNMTSKTDMLEDIVYCNARNIVNYAGWNPNGGNISGSVESGSLLFKNHSNTTDLACPNVTDQFSISNNKAKLTYPIALLQAEEVYNINNTSLMQSTGVFGYATMSPYHYNTSSAWIRFVGLPGTNYYTDVDEGFGIRPVITLASGNVITEGDGSGTSPWIIQE